MSDQYIDLAMVLRQLVRRAPLMAGVFGGCLALAIAGAFLFPRLYEASVQIEPGFLTHMRDPERTSDESVGGQRVESVLALTQRIAGGGYDVRLADALQVAVPALPKLIVRHDVGSPTVQVIARTRDRALAERTLTTLLALVTEDYHGEVEARRAEIQSEKRTLEATAIQLQIDVENYAKTAARIDTEISRYRKNTDELLRRREDLVRAGRTDPIAALLYDNTIQGNLSQVADLQKSHVQLLMQESAARKDLERARNGIAFIEVQARVVSELRIVQRVFSPERPTWPPRSLFVAAGGLVGLFLGVALALALGDTRGVPRPA